MGNLDSASAKVGTTGVRDPQAERQARLHQVATILKKKASGRGVNRKSLQTLAKIHRFNIQYEEADNFLNIAGDNIVDLGITFGGLGTDKEHVVEAVTLELIGSDGDGVKQPEKAQILYKNLTDTKNLPWVDLHDFSANLEYLAYFEELGIKSNAFKTVDSLYDVFQKIWSEEKRRMKWRSSAQHACDGNVGMPCSDQHGRLGIQTRYWTDGRRYHSRDDEEAGDRRKGDTDWDLTVAVEKSSVGTPCIASNRNFLGDEILISTATSENVFRETTDKPAWQNHNSDGSGLALDAAGPTPTRYVATLDPPISLPIQMITILNQVHPMITVDSTSTRTLYDHNNHDRWTKSQIVVDKQGTVRDVSHSYAFYSSDNRDIYCCPVERLSFSHPRYLAEAIPVLRQCALVQTLLRSISPSQSQSRPSCESTAQQRQPVMSDRSEIQRRSNKPQPALDLETLMTKITSRSTTDSSSTSTAIQNIDVTICILPGPVQSDSSTTVPAPTIRLDLLISSPLFSASPLPTESSFTNLSIDIRPNGIISIDDVELQFDRKNGLHEKEKPEQKWKEEAKEKLAKRLAQVTRRSEDLGIVVEFLLREIDG